MKKVFKYCFDKWWRPVVILVLTIIILLISDNYDLIAFSNIIFLLFLISLVGIFISLIYNFATRRWKNAIITSIVFFLSICFLFGYSLISMFAYHPDHYADNLKIPTNLKIEEPLNQTKPSNIADIDFYLYNSLQPGIYLYYFWTKRIDKGEIYLKAFEVTQNDPLSVDRLKESSTISIYNPTDSLVMFQMGEGNQQYGRPFTIYEGGWGKPYAARFELWFVPENGEHERKLIEKNYKIEGWQR